MLGKGLNSNCPDKIQNGPYAPVKPGGVDGGKKWTLGFSTKERIRGVSATKRLDWNEKERVRHTVKTRETEGEKKEKGRLYSFKNQKNNAQGIDKGET